MPQLCGTAGFTQEPLRLLLRRQSPSVRHLHRHAPIQFGIARFPDDAECSGTDLLEQLKFADLDLIRHERRRPLLLQPERAATRGAENIRRLAIHKLDRVVTMRAVDLHCDCPPRTRAVARSLKLDLSARSVLEQVKDIGAYLRWISVPTLVPVPVNLPAGIRTQMPVLGAPPANGVVGFPETLIGAEVSCSRHAAGG